MGIGSRDTCLEIRVAHNKKSLGWGPDGCNLGAGRRKLRKNGSGKGNKERAKKKKGRKKKREASLPCHSHEPLVHDEWLVWGWRYPRALRAALIFHAPSPRSRPTRSANMPLMGARRQSLDEAWQQVLSNKRATSSWKLAGRELLLARVAWILNEPHISLIPGSTPTKRAAKSCLVCQGIRLLFGWAGTA